MRTIRRCVEKDGVARVAAACLLGCTAVACGSGPSSAAGDAGAADSGTATVASPDSGEAAVDSGSGPSPLLLVAAGGVGTAQATEGFSYDLGTDSWSAGIPLGDGMRGAIDSPNGAVSFAFTGPGTALAVLTDATDPTDMTGASGALQFATWAAGQWAPFAGVGAGVNASGAPSLTVGPISLEVAFAGEGARVESSAAQTNGQWSEVTALGTRTGGPPSLAARGADATVVYVRLSDGALVAVDRTSGAWGAESVIEPGTAMAAATPAFAPSLVALSGADAELLVVYTDSNMSDLHFATRAGAKWSPVQDFGLPGKVINTDPHRPDPGAGDSPSPSFATPVLALPDGKAMLAFSSVNQYAYFSQFDGTAWSTATTVFASWGLDTIDSAQVGLAVGGGTAAAEVVFGGSPDSSGAYVPYHTRFIGGQWTPPKNIVATTAGAFALYALASP